MNITEDSIWTKDIRILQPERGYRFALDSVLLAHFLKAGPDAECLEIGAGSGVISVLLSRIQGFKRLAAVEVQPELAELCRRNFEQNGLKNDTVLEGDFNAFALPGSFDLIFSNPPYRKTGTGKLNPHSQKAIARHEVRMKLKDLFECAERLLKPEGRLSVILPVFREQDFINLAQEFLLYLREHQAVHSFPGEPPVFFLATVTRAETECIEHPPRVIYASPGCYTPETARLLTRES